MLKGSSTVEQPGFIFDCDGVLLDSIGAWHDVDRRLTAEAGIELTSEDRDALNASTLSEAGVFFHERFGIGESAFDVVSLMNDYLLEYYRTSVEPKTGALEFVRELHKAGAAIMVLSSSPQAFLQAGLGRTGFLPYLSHIVSAEDMATTKREVATFQHAADLLERPFERIWFFDDSWYALRIAQQTGCRVVGVFSADECGTHEQLAEHASLVIDDFTGMDPRWFLA